jgi:hypothetical protein
VYPACTPPLEGVNVLPHATTCSQPEREREYPCSPQGSKCAPSRVDVLAAGERERERERESTLALLEGVNVPLPRVDVACSQPEREREREYNCTPRLYPLEGSGRELISSAYSRAAY